MALLLRERHVRTLLTMPDTIAVLEDAFGAQVDGKVINHPRCRLSLSTGVLNILAAAVPTFGVLGYKTYTAFREGVRYVVMLFSAHDGELLAIVEADWLGSMRTGAASALATRYMARPNASAVALIGSGKQAMTQLMGICEVCPVNIVYVYSRRQHQREIFCQEMTRLLNINVRSVNSARQAVEVADVVITATTSPDPVVDGAWLSPGCHINAIGSNWPEKRELDSATLQRCSLVVTDSLEQARAEAGDFIVPVEEGLFEWNRVFELADIVSQEAPARESPDEITLYKSLGIALEDVATAAHVYHLARKQNIGEEIDILP
jgi:alanine dehydrogenase